MSLTLQQKKSLRDFEPKRVERLARLKALTGIDFEFVIEPSLEAFAAKATTDAETGYAAQIGDALYGDNGYLEHITRMFEKRWGDELVREALVEACKNKKIAVREKRDWDPVEFENGTLYLNVPMHQFWLYMSYISDFDPSTKL